MRIVVDGDTGKVTSIFNVESGEELVKWPEAAEGAPLRIVCRDKEGRRRVFSPGSATVASAIRSDEMGKFTLTMEHRVAVEAKALAEIPMKCLWTVELDEENPEVSTWALSVENHSHDYDVVEVVFPYVRGVQVSAEAADGVLVFPHHAGEMIENPATALVSDRYTGFWRAASRHEPDGTYSRELNYCGLASMMWMDYYDRNGQGGLYMASYDSDFLLTGVRSETGGPMTHGAVLGSGSTCLSGLGRAGARTRML